jgi:hypothetical protein
MLIVVVSYTNPGGHCCRYTYLDTTGRPVVVLHKKSLVPEHAAKFSIDYSFATTSMLREPIMLVRISACPPAVVMLAWSWDWASLQYRTF